MISVYLMRSLQYLKLSLPSTGVNLLLFFLIIFNLNLFKKLIQKYYHTHLTGKTLVCTTLLSYDRDLPCICTVRSYLGRCHKQIYLNVLNETIPDLEQKLARMDGVRAFSISWFFHTLKSIVGLGQDLLENYSSELVALKCSLLDSSNHKANKLISRANPKYKKYLKYFNSCAQMKSWSIKSWKYLRVLALTDGIH